MLDEIRQDRKSHKCGRRQRSLSVGYAIKDLGLNVGDKLLAYLARPEDEFEIDTLLNGAGKQYYIVFSDRTDIIAAHTSLKQRI